MTGMRRTALLCGNMADPHVELIAAEITDLGGAFELIEESTIPYAVRASYSERTSGRASTSILNRGRKLRPGAYTGAYLRHIDARAWRLPKLRAYERELFVFTWTNFLRMALQESIDRLINPLEAGLSNFYKPLQLATLQETGFLIPRTLVTNDPDQVRQFIATVPDGVVVKSASGVRSVARLFGPEDEKRLPLLPESPAMFQERIRGHNVRVHCVGDRALAVAIRSESLDYRYGGDARMREVILPAAIQSKCLEVTRTLGLHMSGIDLIINKEGYYALEVNPDPAFIWFQKLSGQRISRAVAAYLLGSRH